MPARAARQNLAAVAAGAPIGCSTGPGSYCRLHTFQIRNNSTAQATVRPQGSLLEDQDPLTGGPAAFWNDLGAAVTNIATGAIALITIPDQPLARIRLNVTVLADLSLDVQYIGVE